MISEAEKRTTRVERLAKVLWKHSLKAKFRKELKEKEKDCA